METPFLDRLIGEIKCHVELMTEAEMYEEIPQIKEELAEYEAIKALLKEETKCSGCNKPLQSGLCGDCCSDLASGMF